VTVAASSGTNLRVLAHVDRMGPQYAAYWGLMAQGSLPRVGDSQVLLEVAPSNAVFPLTDRAMKASDVRSAGTLIERDFGLLELHASSPDVVLEAAGAILAELGMTWRDRLAPTVVSSQLLPNIAPDHSQLFNKVRRGAWTLPGDSLFVMEVSPAAYVYLIANELEKSVDVELVRVAGTGLFGRLLVSGTESDTSAAQRTALGVIDGLRAVSNAASLAAGGG
jgi:hypothetical protein